MAKQGVTRREFLGSSALAASATGLAARAASAQENQPMKVKFGLNLLVYTAAFTKDNVDLVKKVADLGYDGVEPLFADLSILDAKATRRACEEAKMGLNACCVMVPEANPVSPKPEVRQAAVARLKQMIDICAEMGGDGIAGPLYAPVRELTGKAPTDDEKKWCADVLRAAAEHADKAKINVAIEPLNRFETYVVTTIADATKLAKMVDHPRLRVQVDTFHANIEERDPAASIRACGPMVGHFHACENDRGTPGTGHVPWKDVFRALKDIKYDRWVTIESFATGILDLCAAACIWRPIYDSADKLAKDGLAFLKKMAAEA
ncbi:MAG: sugar phosphate isomerase/epimerase [Planctomycetes bacterium]|nr:sugar phosphate isomerase/epimerase [Planctomycetota bacterium]